MRFVKPAFLNLTIKGNWFYAILLCLIYGYFAYFLARSEFYLFVIFIAFAFFFSYLLIEQANLKFKQLVWLSILYKLIFLGAVPQLSQDFFRFFWDGQLMLNGVNPYLQNVDFYFVQQPDYIIHNAQVLRQGMGNLNAGNYSNYPPFSQFLYAISAWFAQESISAFIVSLKVILIGFDLVFIYVSRKILIYLNKNPKKVFWYALNPLCILEISGNLHLEGVMIALFVWSIYFLIHQKYLLSGMLLSLSVGTKLMSLIALPLIIMYIWHNKEIKQKYKQIMLILAGFFAVFVIQFLPFLDEVFLNNYLQTIGLWFGKFEFNASIYYLVRSLGYQLYGYNIIQTYGAIMPWLTIILFLLFIFKIKPKLSSVLVSFMWMLTIYFLLSTTVHPWYILFPLALGVFTHYKFSFLWSFLVFLSYSAYKDDPMEESTFIIFLEYTALFVYLGYELFRKKLNRNMHCNSHA
jgi:hypothetical protein